MLVKVDYVRIEMLLCLNSCDLEFIERLKCYFLERNILILIIFLDRSSLGHNFPVNRRQYARKIGNES